MRGYSEVGVEAEETFSPGAFIEITGWSDVEETFSGRAFSDVDFLLMRGCSAVGVASSVRGSISGRPAGKK